MTGEAEKVLFVGGPLHGKLLDRPNSEVFFAEIQKWAPEAATSAADQKRHVTYWRQKFVRAKRGVATIYVHGEPPVASVIESLFKTGHD